MMESSSPPKPILGSHVSYESLPNYKEEISTLPRGNGWSPSRHLCLYKGFWFYPLFVGGAMYARENFQAHPTDVFICSSVKTGSTWLKSLSFAIATRTQFDDSATPLRSIVPHDCVPFLEFGEYYNIEPGPKLSLFSSHIPYQLLPQSIIDSGCKIVYLCRDPKDTFVSMWHFYRKIFERQHKEQGAELDFVSIEEGLELFSKGVSSQGPYWDHVLGYWKASLDRPDQILFLKYEEMMEETDACVKRLAEFLGCPFSEDEEREGMVQRIVKLCSFECLSNLEVNKKGMQVKGNNDVNDTLENNAYFRKGKVGDWRNYLTAEMGERLDKIVKDRLSGSGFSFGYNKNY